MKLYGHPDSGHAFKVKFFMQWANIEHNYEMIDDELSDNRPYILGETPQIADFALYGYLVHANEAEVPVPAHVSAWLKRMGELNGWQHPYEMLKA